MKPCVIFDLDGTLCDTSADLLAAANAAFRVLGRDVTLDHGDAEARSTALLGGRAMLRLGLGRLGEVDGDEVDRGYQPLLDAYDGAVSTHTRFYPGARDAVGALREAGYGVAICTNKPERLAVKLMAELGATDEFDALVGADTLCVRKPDPAPFWEAIKRSGGDPTRSLLVGDTATDAKTATAARAPFVLARFAAAPDAPPGDAEIGHYDELATVVLRLIGRPYAESRWTGTVAAGA